MAFSQEIKAMYNERTRTIQRVGVVGELVLAATVPLFTIVGGAIKATMFGIIRVGIGANITTVQLLHTVTAQALSAASGNLTGQVAGIHLNPTGAVGAAIAISAGTSVGVGQVTPWSLSIGGIGILVGGATTLVGAIDWYLTYEPMLDTCVVVAV